MLETSSSYRGMVVAPHRLAAQAGLRVLQDGGNAIEAMVTAAAAISVVYPHMNSIGGDNFWLISKGGKVWGVDSCGASGADVTIKNYSERGLQEIPARGGDAAITVAGAVAGWEAALKLSHQFGGRLPLTRLLEDAIWYAKEGFPVSKNLAETISSKRSELLNIGGFEELFLINGEVPEAGSLLRFPKLASTLEFLSRAGLNDFYYGDVSLEIVRDLERSGSPLKREDFIEHCAKLVEPLALTLSSGRVFNMPPPTQGLASLIILGILERLDPVMDTTPEFVHSIVEATKKAFEIRD
ncbi:MAG: gamma-glutamyltransferase, partial [Pseudomonadota bacterium]|nr:gamma-glutamyltransferase [Pseudomonadota bacterium]